MDTDGIFSHFTSYDENVRPSDDSSSLREGVPIPRGHPDTFATKYSSEGFEQFAVCLKVSFERMESKGPHKRNSTASTLGRPYGSLQALFRALRPTC